MGHCFTLSMEITYFELELMSAASLIPYVPNNFGTAWCKLAKPETGLDE